MPPELPSIIALDFDGTCVTHEYPKIGREIGAPGVLHELVKRGCKLILWTMRSDNRQDGTTPLTDAVKWFEGHGIPLFGIQRNPDQDTWTSSPKAYAKLYIDDAALGAPLCLGLKGERPFIDWDAVRRLLLPDTIHGEATGKTYQFTTFQELFDTVPGARMRECFTELGEGLAPMKIAAEMTAAMIKLLNPRADIPPSLAALPSPMEWIDDGKGEIQPTMKTEDEGFSLTLSKKRH